MGNLYNQGSAIKYVVEGKEGVELDSYMYQTVGTNATIFIAKALDKPLYRRPIIGKPKNVLLEYNKPEEGDEV